MVSYMNLDFTTCGVCTKKTAAYKRLSDAYCEVLLTGLTARIVYGAHLTGYSIQY